MKKGANTMQGVIVLLALLIVGGLGFMLYKEYGEDQAVSIAPAQQAQTEVGQEVVTAKVSCPADGTSDGQIRYEDGLAATNTYGNPTCYFVPKTAGLERVTSGSLQTDGTYSTAVDLKCTSSGTKWRAICVSSQDGYHSVDEGKDFTAEGSYVKRDLMGKAFDVLKFKVEDKFTGGATFFNVTCGNNEATSYVDFENGRCNITEASGSALTIGTDEYIDARIYIKTNHTKKQFGEDGLRTWFLVDADGSSWDEPIVSRDGGPTLVNQFSNIADEDRRKYSGYEYAYEIGSVGDRESYLDFYMETAAGVNPGTSARPVFDFCSEGRYNSNKQVDSILVGCWTDAATQAEVTTAFKHQAIFITS